MDRTNKYGRVACGAAMNHHALDIVQYLVEACNFDVETRNSRGDTALLHACRHSYRFSDIEIFPYLVEKCNANVNAKNKLGETHIVQFW